MKLEVPYMLNVDVFRLEEDFTLERVDGWPHTFGKPKQKYYAPITEEERQRINQVKQNRIKEYQRLASWGLPLFKD